MLRARCSIGCLWIAAVKPIIKLALLGPGSLSNCMPLCCGSYCAGLFVLMPCPVLTGVVGVPKIGTAAHGRAGRRPSGGLCRVLRRPVSRLPGKPCRLCGARLSPTTHGTCPNACVSFRPNWSQHRCCSFLLSQTSVSQGSLQPVHVAARLPNKTNADQPCTHLNPVHLDPKTGAAVNRAGPDRRNALGPADLLAALVLILF